MVTPRRRYNIGDTVYLPDGRRDVIRRVDFDVRGMRWTYFLTDVAGLFQEAGLFALDPRGIGALPGGAVEIDAPEPTSAEPLILDELERLELELLERLELLSERLTLRLADLGRGLADLRAEFETTADDLRGRIVTQQSQLNNRLQGMDDAADESGGGGASGLFRRIGGFLLSPFETVRAALEQYILDEVRAGLNR